MFFFLYFYKKMFCYVLLFFFQAEDGIRDPLVTGVQTCALPIWAKDLGGLTWISREEGSATREAVESARWQIGLRSVRTLELPSWESVKLAVASGAGIAAISRFALNSELETGALAILEVPRWRLQRTIAVRTARDVPLPPPADSFLE